MNYVLGARKSHGARVRIVLALVVSALAGMPIESEAQPTYSVLYKFQGGSTEPAEPVGILAQGRDGNLYGASFSGGTSTVCAGGCGTIYRMTLLGQPTVLYSFLTHDECGLGLTLGTDGNFYGGCTHGGTRGHGYIFQFVLASASLNVLYNFCRQQNCSDGATPSSRPIEGTDGNYYGTTQTGGAYGYGTVYRITPTRTHTILHSFNTDPNPNSIYPRGPLSLGSDGNLYGTTQGSTTNSCSQNCGTVYTINNSGTFFEVLHTFTGAPDDGATPTHGLIQGIDGSFYGTTAQGGTFNLGTIFSMVLDAGGRPSLEILHSFSLEDSIQGIPRGIEQTSNGDLFGYAAGTKKEDGSLFGITQEGGPLIYTYVFADHPGTGDDPDSAASDTDGKLYGVTDSNGLVSKGVFYRLSSENPLLFPMYCRPQTIFGQEGRSVEILGQGFDSSSVVSFNGVQATQIAVTGQAFITATIPRGARSGLVTVTTGSQTLTSLQNFYILPSGPSPGASVAH
jgi:uncharacterized repeat protein (TIGR03803 family)